MLDGRSWFDPAAVVEAPFGLSRCHPHEVNDLFAAGDYGLRAVHASGQLRLVGEATGNGLVIGTEPTWSELYRMLIRMRRTRRRIDSGWLRRLSVLLESAGSAWQDTAWSGHADSAGWSRLAAAVRTDAVLATHCAVPADALPIPRHPRFPGGTVAVSLPGLITPSPQLPNGLLRDVVHNRFERTESELAYFLEQFVRPLVRAFRMTMERHRVGVLSMRGGVRFELSPELEATGRIVFTEQAQPQELGSTHAGPDSADIDAGVRSLVSTLDSLAAGFVACGFAATGCREPVVRASVDGVVAEELRDVDPHTAKVLVGKHPLRRFVHSVAPQQDEILKRILHRVQERVRRRRWDKRLPMPTVVIDLDSCAIAPHRKPDAAFAAEKLSGDTVPGLARFVWDVRDTGGKVVFCTRRPESERGDVEGVLHAAGVPATELLFRGDERCGPVSDVLLAGLRENGEADVVAIFAGTLRDACAIKNECPGRSIVAVEVTGPRTEPRDDQLFAGQTPVIATFETSPWRRDSGRMPALSHSHSIEELQVPRLRSNRQARRWVVRMTEAETMSIVDSVIADADRSAQRTAGSARRKFGMADDEVLAGGRQHDHAVRVLHHLFTRKQFVKGSRRNYTPRDMERDIAGFVERDRPIEVVLLGFPIKQCLNRLKAFGPLPDLAELGGLARLRELQRAVQSVYPAGLHFNILTDGRHFRPRPAAAVHAYCRKLREYTAMVGIDECASVSDIDELACRHLGAQLPGRRAALFDKYRRALAEVVRDCDITRDPLRTLEAITRRASEVDGRYAAMLQRSLGMFSEMLMSMVYSVPVPAPRGVDRLTWSRMVYADVYNLDDATASQEIRQSRVAVLRRSWHNVIRYLATLRVDEALDYEGMFPERVRLTVSAVTPGRCGFTYLGGSGLLPWKGTGVLDSRGRVAVDFAVALLDQGFVPAYSPLLGPRQPWMMVPAHATRPAEPDAGTVGARLDPDFAARARLRRK